MIDPKIYYIFALGAILTLFYYIEEAIEKQEYKEKSFSVIALLALAKSIIGGILIVIIFYTLQELNLEFKIFDTSIKPGLWGNLFIAGTFSLFGSDLFKIIKNKTENIVSKGE